MTSARRRVVVRVVGMLVAGVLAVGTSVVAANPAAAVTATVVGRVLQDGAPVSGAAVNVGGRHSNYPGAATVFTDQTGHFTLTGVAPGDLTIAVHYVGAPAPGWVRTYLGDTAFRSEAHFVTVGTSTVDVGDISMIRGGRIQGTVTLPAGISGNDLHVSAWVLDESTGHLSGLMTMGVSSSGGYNVWPLPPGGVVLRIAPRTIDIEAGAVYADGASRWWETELIEVAAGGSYAAAPVAVPGQTREALGRFGGATRFDTGALLSQWAIPDVDIPVAGVPTVYIANGLSFPDGLSAGPIAAIDGSPLLLVMPHSIPDVVADELARLRPQTIVIVGGPGVVSESVRADLEQYAAGSVERVQGADRYATSRALARSAFVSATTAIVASGANFPDALAAGPAAAAYEGPVILIPAGSSVDAATRQLLIDLGVSTILIAGGEGVVSADIERALAAIPGVEHVYRHGGSDRYETAASLAGAVQGRFPPDEVYLVSGGDFPDALAATWLAGYTRAAIFLSPVECLSAWGQHVVAKTPDVYLVGGEGVLSPAVADLQLCSE
jgi:putative cell wall-binding protein